MTEVAEEVIGHFPIEELCFILTAGLFITLTFPFDIGKVLSSPVDINWAELPSIISSNFKPFVNLLNVLASEHVGELFVVLLLSCIPVGVMIYLSLTVYEKANKSVGDFLKKYKLDPKRRVRWMWDTTSKKEHRVNNRNDEFISADDDHKLRFYEWLGAKKIGRFVLFLWAMRSVSEALLYGSETFGLLTLMSAIIPMFWNQVSTEIWIWVVYSTFIFFVIYVFVYSPFKAKYDMYNERYYKSFRKEELVITDEADFV